jgi:hypothetical protein
MDCRYDECRQLDHARKSSVNANTTSTATTVGMPAKSLPKEILKRFVRPLGQWQFRLKELEQTPLRWEMELSK